MKRLSIVLLALLAGTACRNPSNDEEFTALSSPAATGPAPIVTGTVLDARTGKPIAGARVRGPGGVEAKSDAQGRFVLRGLPLGASGELVATTESGMAGKNPLRPLEGGPLEVVLRLL